MGKINEKKSLVIKQGEIEIDVSAFEKVIGILRKVMCLLFGC